MKGVSTVKHLVCQLAWKAWRTLPRQHQIWIGVDDLVEDGMFKAYQVINSKWYDPNKAALTTVVYHAVHNHYMNEYIKKYGNESRFASLESAGIVDYDAKHKQRKEGKKGLTPAGVVSLDALATTDERGLILTPPQLSTSEDVIYNNVLTDCFVVPTLVKIYKEASNRLQEEMVEWFLPQEDKYFQEDTRKSRSDNKRFRHAAKEFRMLSEDFNLTYYDCLHLIRSARCTDTLSRELFHIPYMLDYPAPEAELRIC